MARKTENLSIRISPEIKRMLSEIAEREHRSASNLIETMILERCNKFGLKAAEIRHTVKQRGKTDDAER
jgi:predicted transcriptional regulator